MTSYTSISSFGLKVIWTPTYVLTTISYIGVIAKFNKDPGYKLEGDAEHVSS